MGKTVFVPLTDDLLYEHPERILGPVIPFSQQARRAAVESSALEYPAALRFRPAAIKVVDRQIRHKRKPRSRS